MGKKLRYILLSFSVVLAIFVFALLWQVRPDFDSSVLDEARDRQDAQLVNVSQPLETSTSARAENEAIISEVVERVESDDEFVSSLSSSAEESAKAYIDSLVADPAVEEALADRILERLLSDSEVQERIAAYVDSEIAKKEAEYATYIDNAISDITISATSGVDRAAMRAEIEKYVNENLVYADDIIDSRINLYVEENLPYADGIIDGRINKYVDENIGYIDSAVTDGINEYVNANLPAAKEIINGEINAYVNENLPAAEDIIDSRISLYAEENIPYIESMIDDKIVSYVTENTPYAERRVNEIIDQYVLDYIELKDNAIYVTDPDTTELDRRISEYVDENLSYANELIDSRIDLYVEENAPVLDAIIEDVVEEYYAANFDVINEAASAYFAKNLLDASSSKSGDTVYDEVIYSVASDISGALSGSDAKSYGDLSSYEENVLSAIENIVLEVLNRLDYVVAGSDVSVSSYTADEDQRAVSGPAFSFENTDSLINQNRDDVRRAAIRSVLESLSD